LNEGKSFNEAVSIVAEHRKKWPTTIRDHCTRQMGLTGKEFKLLIKDKNSFISHLVKHFPEWEEVIVKEMP